MNKELKNQKIVVCVSGGGRTLENLLQHQSQYAYQIGGVIASSRHCGGAAIAKKHGLPLYTDDFSLATKEQTQDKVRLWLDDIDPALVVLAGFIRLFPVLPGWERKVVNIHPALLPKYGGQGMYGKRVHQAVVAAGDQVSGATVHYINERYDEGQIIAQINVPISKKDGVDEVAKKVFTGECQLYPLVIHRLLERTLPLSDGRVWLLSGAENGN